MEKEPITVECCKVDENVDLQADELSTLICDFDGKTSDANITDGTVSCHAPKVTHQLVNLLNFFARTKLHPLTDIALSFF